ncbi:MAG: hypothetical protein ACFFBS_09080 [Promethearchaeota archaeon]
MRVFVAMTPERIKIAALVKYNPCSVHARGGVPCPFFISGTGRKCKKPLGCCEMLEYDEWFKEVLKGKMKSFYPRRIRLLEIPGTILLLYHAHMRKIAGEAKIINATSEDNIHHYWFDNFVAYPNPVGLKLLHTDSRLKLIAKLGRWGLVYLSEETLEEIRSLSELKGKSRERLRREVELAKQEAAKRPYLYARPSPKERISKIRREIAPKLSNLGTNAEIMKEAERIFLKACEKALLRGRSYTLLFFASLYSSFRVLGIPMSLREFGEMTHYDVKKIASLARILQRELDIKFHSITLRDWVSHYSSNLGLSDETIRIAKNLLDKMETDRRLIGISPLSISATAVYLASRKTKEGKTPKRIAEAFGVSSVTIRNVSKRWLSLKKPQNAM